MRTETTFLISHFNFDEQVKVEVPPGRAAHPYTMVLAQHNCRTPMEKPTNAATQLGIMASMDLGQSGPSTRLHLGASGIWHDIAPFVATPTQTGRNPSGFGVNMQWPAKNWSMGPLGQPDAME